MTFSLTDIKTSADVANRDLEQAKQVARLECRNRIVAICDETAQINLAADAAAGRLTAEQLATYRAGLAWVEQMRASWEPIAVNGDDPFSDASWPAVPAGVAELANQF